MVYSATIVKYFSYIVVVSFIAGGTGVPAENHLPVTRL
jgi:hypothetical protein